MSELVIENVEACLVPIGTADSMELLFEVMRSSEVAVDHRVWGDALAALESNEQKVSRVYSGHNRVVGLETPANPEGIIRQSRCIL